MIPYFLEEAGRCVNRGFTTGFFFGKPGQTAQIYDHSTYYKNYTYLGCVEESGGTSVVISQRNKFSVGDEIFVMHPGGKDESFVVTDMRDEDGRPVMSAPHPKQKIRVRTEGVSCGVFDVLYKRETE